MWRGLWDGVVDGEREKAVLEVETLGMGIVVLGLLLLAGEVKDALA